MQKIPTPLTTSIPNGRRYPTVLSAPPPRPAGQINVIPFPPPIPFAGAPNSVFQVTVLPFPPPPPFEDGPPSSVDLSPPEFLLVLLAVVTVPALIYIFFFAFSCPSRRRRRDLSAGEPSVASEVSHHHEIEIPDTGVKYSKEAHAKEIGGECPVCLSAFADGEEVRQLSACKHSFHSSCIDLWLSNHSNCPICRAIIVSATTTVTKDDDSQQNHRQADAARSV